MSQGRDAALALGTVERTQTGVSEKEDTPSLPSPPHNPAQGAS